jgi:sugar phosphate isomerase/epimerase
MRPNRTSSHSLAATASSTTARIFHVHLRDYRHTAAGRVAWTTVSQGEFDNLGQIRALLVVEQV